MESNEVIVPGTSRFLMDLPLILISFSLLDELCVGL